MPATKNKKNKINQKSKTKTSRKDFAVRTIIYIPYVYVWTIKYLYKHVFILFKKTAISAQTYSKDLANDFKEDFISLKHASKKTAKWSKTQYTFINKYTTGLAQSTRKIDLKVNKSTSGKKKIIKSNRTSINIKSRALKAYSLMTTFFKKSFSLAIRLILIPFKIIFWPFKVLKNILSKVFTWKITIKVFSFKTLFALFLVLIIYAGSLLYFTLIKDLPSINKLESYTPKLTSTIYDRKGNILYRLYDGQDRTLVPFEVIPKNLVNATIAIEDQDFYNHQGISVRGIARAAKKTIFEDKREGGSTITQQLVKNTILTSDKTLERKIKEAILAIELERKYSKNQILEIYLNTIPFGGTSYGVKAAAKKYFDKELDQLSLAESAFLAGLPAAPTNFSPYSAKPQLGEERKNLVLQKMLENNFITQEEYQQAKDEQLMFSLNNEKIVAPHFVNYVLAGLEQKYGKQMLQQGGLEIYTTIDLELQNKAEEIVLANVEPLKKYNVNNGSILITNPKTGEVLAMVGSVDFWDTKNDGEVNVTTAQRQPGSSIKPITYSLVFERGLTPETYIVDQPITYNIPGQKPYKPVNYDGRFHGKINLRTALANSYNIPAVKLLESVGLPDYIAHARKLGITTWDDPSRYGLSLTLGAGEVKMTDMAVVYGTFANGGYKKELNPILRIYGPFGDIIENNTCVDLLQEGPSILTSRMLFKNKVFAADDNMEEENEISISCPKEKVLSDQSAYFISSILSDNKARIPAFGPNNELGIKTNQIAVKTGTTQNLRDNWAIGYTDDYVVVSWVGNNDNTIMKNVVSGYRGSSTMWRQSFDYLIANRNVKEKLTMPTGMIEVEICPLTDTLACEGCPNIKRVYQKGSEPTIKCDKGQIDAIYQAQAEAEKSEDDNNDHADDDWWAR